MNHTLTLASFLFCTGLVGLLTWLITRKDDHESSVGFFLAGRRLTFPLIAGSLLLTNLSTEQLVGLNADAFKDGLCVMVWEVVAVIGLVAMAMFFLPRFLKSGVATVPEYLELRFDHTTAVIANLIFLIAYVGILLPIVLYTGATGLIGVLDIKAMLGLDPATALYFIVWIVGVIGALYALFGGLRTVAVSDTINAIGLLIGGFMITGFALRLLGQGDGIVAGAQRLATTQADRFNSIGSHESSVPFGTVFTGILLLHLFYWTTNQQIIQRTLGARSLAEGQKGVMLTALFKLLGPLYLVLPGMIALAVFADEEIKAVESYGMLVNRVLPDSMTGFFAAVMIGAILSSFNSVLNSSCTIFSLGIYKNMVHPEATELQVVRAGKRFGWIVTVAAMLIAPMLAQTESIFGYLQTMSSMYAIPILSVVLIGMTTRRIPAIAATTALLGGLAIIALGYFVPPFNHVLTFVHQYHFVAMVFAFLIGLMLLIGAIRPRESDWIQVSTNAVDMTPWKHAKLCAGLLVICVLAIYAIFADLLVLIPNRP